jgi:hypothetical protein
MAVSVSRLQQLLNQFASFGFLQSILQVMNDKDVIIGLSLRDIKEQISQAVQHSMAEIQQNQQAQLQAQLQVQLQVQQAQLQAQLQFQELQRQAQLQFQQEIRNELQSYSRGSPYSSRGISPMREQPDSSDNSPASQASSRRRLSFRSEEKSPGRIPSRVRSFIVF